METPDLNPGEAQSRESLDVFYILDRMEDIVGDASKVPLSGKVMVDSDEFLDMVEQLRITLPDEIRQAQRVIREREQIIADAQFEAEHILDAARQRADYILSNDGLLNEARQRGEEILHNAELQKKQALGEIDVYAMDQFQTVEDALREGLTIIDEAVQQVVANLNEGRNSVGR